MTELTKKGQIQTFSLTGKVMINNYTFKLNEKSKNNPNYIYNQLSLSVNCGKNGTINAEMMGGYNIKNPMSIRVHGKNEDGTDNFSDKFDISWDDRMDPDTVERVGYMNLIRVAVERDESGKLIEKRFLHAYDVIEYLHNHLKNGDTVFCRGRLEYTPYNGMTNCKKVLNYISLSDYEETKFNARFTQTYLLDKYSMKKENCDMKQGILHIDAKVLEYVNKYDDVTVKQILPLNVGFEYHFNKDNPKLKEVLKMMFEVNKDVTEITFDGQIFNGGKVVTATIDDLPQDIQQLIAIGVLNEEEELNKVTSGRSVDAFVVEHPHTKNTLVDNQMKLVLCKTERKYKETDLQFDLESFKNNTNTDTLTVISDDDLPFDIDDLKDNKDINALFG